MTRKALVVAALLGFTAAARRTQAQSIAERVAAVRDGVVLMSFAAKPGVCGNGGGSIWTNDSWNRSGPSNNQVGCMAGPVRVSLGRADDTTISVRVVVGGKWTAVAAETDLGTVAAADAARYLIGIAHGIGGRSGSDAVSAAAIADVTDVAPGLVSLVHDTNAPLDPRRQALYWAGQTSLPTRDLARLYDGLTPFALREQFTFVISQRRDDAAIDKLIDVARTDPDLEIRKRAMYWLGQTQDPRAVKFLRDLVTR